MKQSLSGIPFSSWNITEIFYCHYTGIGCDSRGYVTDMDFSGWSVSGNFPGDVCSYLPELHSLRIVHTNINGSFPDGINNCTLLEELNMTSLYLTGTLPDFSPMKFLRILDLSYNLFSGVFPASVTNLTDLEVLNFNENGNFNPWQLTEEISRLSKLQVMILTACMLQGAIPKSIGNMLELVDLELSGNFLSGTIPSELGKLNKLQQLELFYNEYLSGEIPAELGNLTELIDLDLSVNQLTGKIPESIFNTSSPTPHLYTPPHRRLNTSPTVPTINFPTSSPTAPSTIPTTAYPTPSSTEPSTFQPKNPLPPPTSTIPSTKNHATSSGSLQNSAPTTSQQINLLPPLTSTVHSTAHHPRPSFPTTITLLLKEVIIKPRESLGASSEIIVLVLSENRLTGELPPDICKGGSVPKSISNAKDLKELFIQNNRIAGTLPPEISQAGNLVKVNLSNNIISGPIPTSLSSLKSLKVLDLSRNHLTGNIPESICELLPSSVNFSNNNLSGPVPLSLIRGGLAETLIGYPGLCVYGNTSVLNFPVCPQLFSSKRKQRYIWLILASVVVVIIGLALFIQRPFSKRKSTVLCQDELITPSHLQFWTCGSASDSKTTKSKSYTAS
ncbi:hypothetical protein C5167_017875 [Papaver somniferum]|uniref:Disease resistance R13L4/SHOC-2-like LRR domain-containing protein n=1 Tax=Papaver somniferum TaxID=3469 RepID=A0A4Y7IPR1_PAPSO|nr:hypothetical protein C5167_017875 [Papaver somniferum]